MNGKRRRAIQGLTLVEIIIAVAIFAVAGLGFMGMMMMSSRENVSTRQRIVALQGARAKVEEMLSVPFDEIFARYNADVVDDPADVVSPGPNFAVDGLEPRAGDADGLAGQVVFPMIGAALREDVDDAQLEMPRDLNNDGAVDALDHSGDYRVLPVIIRVEWRGVNGDGRLEYRTRLFPR